MVQNEAQTTKDVAKLLELSSEAQNSTGQYLKQIDRSINGVGGEVVKATKTIENIEGETKRYERALENYGIQQDKLIEANTDIKNGLKKLHAGTDDVQKMLDNTKDIVNSNQKSTQEQQTKILKSIEESHNSASTKVNELNKLLSDTDNHIKDLDKHAELNDIKQTINNITKIANDYDETNAKRHDELKKKLDDTDLKLTNAINQVSSLVSKTNDMNNQFTSLLSSLGKIAVQVDGLNKAQPLVNQPEIELTTNEDVKPEIKGDNQVVVTEKSEKANQGPTNHKQNKKQTNK